MVKGPEKPLLPPKKQWTIFPQTVEISRAHVIGHFSQKSFVSVAMCLPESLILANPAPFSLSVIELKSPSIYTWGRINVTNALNMTKLLPSSV